MATDSCAKAFGLATNVAVMGQMQRPTNLMTCGLVCQFVEREGHPRVTKGYLEGGYRLGQWVGVQRGRYTTGRITADRIARLQALPGWSWNTKVEPRA
jgi:hypothetical protein